MQFNNKSNVIITIYIENDRTFIQIFVFLQHVVNSMILLNLQYVGLINRLHKYEK